MATGHGNVIEIYPTYNMMMIQGIKVKWSIKEGY